MKEMMKKSQLYHKFIYLCNMKRTLKGHKNVLIIIAAALLVELFSAAQYYYAHDLLEQELDNRAESELRVKAILIRGILNVMEKTVNEHVWDIRRNIANPDSMFDATARIIQNTPKAEGSCLVFTPGFYPTKAKLFEPYAYKAENGVQVKDLCAEGDHDYTQHPAYKKMEKELEPFWSDPYISKTDSTEMALTTYSYPLKDKDNKLMAICGLDVSLEQIGDTLNARHIYPSSFNLLLTESGEIISGPSEHHPKAHDMEQVVRLINDSIVKRKTSNSGHSKYIVFKSEADNSSGCLYYANMKGNPHWQLAVVCYDNEVYGDLYLMRFKIFLLMLLGMGVLGFVIHRFANNERKLNKAKIQQERLSSELRIAQEIQMGMLPKEFTPYDDRNDLQIFGSLVPAREVGGDLYDFFLRDEKLFFCIGDVSGKGVPSAIIMAEIHSQFRMASVHETNPAHIMQTLNTASCEGNEKNIFITFFIGVLDLPTGRLRYCNAGHDIPYLIQSADGHEISQLPVIANIPIGLFDDFEFKMQETVINEDTTIFLYTDGLTEAKNVAHEQFGISRIEKVLEQNTQIAPEGIIGTMSNEVHQFMEQEEQSDDLTMLAIKYTPKKNEYTNEEELMLTNDVKFVDRLNEFVKSITDKLNVDTSKARSIKLAVEEAVVNVMEYAYPAGTTGDISLKVMYNERKMKFVITDSGVAFNPTEATLADTTLSVEERPIGGLGLLLVRELMDSINYERIDNKNTLTLITHYKQNEQKQTK